MFNFSQWLVNFSLQILWKYQWTLAPCVVYRRNIYAPYGFKCTLQGNVRWFDLTLSCIALTLVWVGVNVSVLTLRLVLVGWLPRLQRGHGFKHWLLCWGVENEITHIKGKRVAFYLFFFSFFLSQATEMMRWMLE